MAAGVWLRVVVMAALAVLLAYSPRIDAAARFRASKLGALFHPLGVLLLLTLQWYAVVMYWFGRPVSWKGRPQPVPA